MQEVSVSLATANEISEDAGWLIKRQRKTLEAFIAKRRFCLIPEWLWQELRALALCFCDGSFALFTDRKPQAGASWLNWL